MESQGIFQIYPMFTGRAGKHSVGRVLRGEKNRSSENCGFCFGSGSCGPVGSSALRANIARFFVRLRARGMGLRWGRCPHTPARELSSLDLPLFALNHAALSARPRVPREHCAFLCAPAGARDGVRWGIRPPKPSKNPRFLPPPLFPPPFFRFS